MLLAKRCMREHLVTVSPTLKLGTLYGYRTIENDDLVDSEEGVLRINLVLDGEVDVSKRWLKYITSGITILGGAQEDYPPFYGLMRMRLSPLFIVRDSGNHVLLKDSKVLIEREEVDCFIFCMSLVRNTRYALALFPGYNDCWYCSELSADAILILVADKIVNAAKAAYRDGVLTLPEGCTDDDIEINARYGPVKYMSREIHFSGDGESEVESTMLALKDMALIKPSAYAQEKEFRFIFQLIAKQNFVLPWTQDLFIPVPELVERAFTI
ncbi:MAG: hypothetical protein ACRYF9_25765 [Janthinobacterium lividum]